MGKTVFLTGASGNMGWAGFNEIYNDPAKHTLVVLLRGNEKNKLKFRKFEGDSRVRIIWGDLTDYDTVLAGVRGADVVLHVGGMVSPAADYFPKKTLDTNTAAAMNIVNAVQAQPNKDDIRVVYIGTVAETGDRNPPIHWGRTGDPIKISVYDHYAISKVIAERIFAESGLKHWVSLRQSGILYANILKNFDPIMFHVPINGVLEWATVEDSATLLDHLCADDIPEDFWRSFYNIGSGDQYRITNFEFEELLLDTIGLGDPRKLFQPNWFITRNFHGQWYADSDKLEEYLHFRHNVPVRQYFKRLRDQAPPYFRLAVLAKPFAKIVGKVGLEPLTKTKTYGTMSWIGDRVEDRISAYYGSIEDWEKIPGWNEFKIIRPSETPNLLDHGYDETKPLSELDLEDMKKAAAFRGGECLSESMEKGDLFTPLKWKSARGNEFSMTPNLVLRGGHWCPDELPMPWDYDTEARINPFFAQVWYPLHDKHENNFYDKTIYKGYAGYEKL